jgi:hypothetical protein
MGGLAGGLNFGRNNNAGTQSTGVNQSASMRISDIRSNYNYPNWFDTTMGYYRDGKISSEAFESAYANLTKQGLITLKTGGTPATASGSFESLFPKQTSQLIKIGQDTTALGKINIRQDESIAGYRTEFDNALTHRQTNQANITSNTEKLEDLFSSQQAIWDSIGQKADMSHTHAGGGESEKDCGWFGEKCWFPDPDDWDLGWLKWVGLAIGAGLLLWLIRPLLKIGANLSK